MRTQRNTNTTLESGINNVTWETGYNKSILGCVCARADQRSILQKDYLPKQLNITYVLKQLYEK